MSSSEDAPSEDELIGRDVEEDADLSGLSALINHGIRLHFNSNEDEEAAMNDFLGQQYNEGDDQHRDPQDPRGWNPKIKEWADQDIDEEPDVFIDRPEPTSTLNSRTNMIML
jgi:hypothetical protein